MFMSGVATELDVPGPMLAKPFGPSAFLEQVARMCRGAQHH
jgi:hypothetical protein